MYPVRGKNSIDVLVGKNPMRYGRILCVLLLAIIVFAGNVLAEKSTPSANEDESPTATVTPAAKSKSCGLSVDSESGFRMCQETDLCCRVASYAWCCPQGMQCDYDNYPEQQDPCK